MRSYFQFLCNFDYEFYVNYYLVFLFSHLKDRDEFSTTKSILDKVNKISCDILKLTKLFQYLNVII